MMVTVTIPLEISGKLKSIIFIYCVYLYAQRNI